MIGAGAPFLLFDDARQGGSARLYAAPAAIVETRDPQQVRTCLDQLRQALADGLHVAGFLSYEAGYALEPRLAPLARTAAPDAPPLLWFGLFERAQIVKAEEMLPAAGSARAASQKPCVDQADYEETVRRIKEHIFAGDIYQANLTFQNEVAVAGDPLALYAGIRDRAKAGHGGLVRTSDHWLLSFSPELFFTLDNSRIVTRPMKGTAPRHADPAADRAAAQALKADEKQRAENLMIVDLLRNDLSRIARPGSVKVLDLFTIETYPTVHQMTSTIVAEAKEGVGAIDIIAAIFPCGSITGAPKIRAMEIIAAMERGPRGPYTGSIGWAAPDGSASFNVAIRTLTLGSGSRMATLGLGSGIVADSRAGDEWRECLTKGAFVSVTND